jgi:hypothetical protein
MMSYDRQGAQHRHSQILPMISSYVWALQRADLPPSYFFSRNFSIDTGQIVNQGRAWHEFRGLASAPNIPMNPREERGFGHNSLVSNQGNLWRWAPSPVSGDQSSTAKVGVRNQITPKPGFIVEEINPNGFVPISDDGRPLRRYHVSGLTLERSHLSESTPNRLLPGLVYQRP